MSKDIAKTVTLPATVEEAVGLPKEALDELDYSAIPTIVNDGESFKVRNGSFRLDDEFNAVILDISDYWYVKCDNPNHAVPGVYTYDGKTSSAGDDLEEIKKMWEQDGCGWKEMPYAAVKVLMLTPDAAFNAIAQCNISPTSVKRVKAYVALEVIRQRRLQPHQVVTRFSLGNAVRGAGGKMFRPWEVQFIGEFDLDEFNKQLNGS